MCCLQGAILCHSGRSSCGPSTHSCARSKHLNLRRSHGLCWLDGRVLTAQYARQVGPEWIVLGRNISVLLVATDRHPSHWRYLFEISHDLLSRGGAFVLHRSRWRERCLHELLLVLAASQLLDHVGVALFDLALQAHNIDLEESYLVADRFLQLSCSGSLILYMHKNKIRFIKIRINRRNLPCRLSK